MSSKRAMKQAQKQAYARHRSNITNSRFNGKKKFLNSKSKKNLRFIKLNFFQKKIYLLKVELSNQALKEL